MGWVSSYRRRRLAFFSSATVSFGIGDAWVLIVTLGSATLGFLLIDDGFFWDRRRLGWRRLAFFSSATVSFGIGDAWVGDGWLSSHRRCLGSHHDAWVGKLRRRFGGESESDLFGSIFLFWYFFFGPKTLEEWR